MPKQGTEEGAVLLRDNSITTLLAICEFVAEKLGEKLNPKIMLLTLNSLDKLFLKGEKRVSKKGNPWGCKGKPKHDVRVKKTLEEYPVLRRGI